MIRFLAIASGLLLTSASLHAQAPVALTKADAQLSEPFTGIRSVRELPSGKVLVSDLRDKVVQLVDFAAGSMTKVGREGQGPGEYALPSTLYGMPNGVTWLHDMLGRRFLSIDANGKPGEAIQMPGGPGGGVVAMGMNGGGSDDRGRIYTQAPPFSFDGPNGAPPDSNPITWWDPGTKKVDTVAYIKGPKAQVSGGRGGGRFEVRLGASKVFTPQESWGVAADGSVARVLPSPYQVIWYDLTGKPTAGTPIPYTPLKVTDADKQQVIEARKKMRPMMIAIGGPGGRAAAPPANFEPQPPEFEDTKPPFTGENSVVVTPEGEVWVLRTRPASDKTPSYDVFDRTGKLARKVTLNPNSRVIGFGKGTVYVVRTDDDDLQYLERFRRR